MSAVFTRKPGEDLLKNFFKSYKPVSYKTGDIILHPKDNIYSAHFVASGYISQQIISENGEDFIVNIHRPGSYFPIALVLHGARNDYYYESLTDTVIYKAPIKDILTFLKNNPAAMEELLIRLSSGLNTLASKTEALIFGTASRKIAATLYFTAQRFGKKKSKELIIDFPLTHKRIAAMTGVTRETASIEMMKLKKDNILSYQGKQVTVLDMVKLHRRCICDD
ncbi:MAG: Crp/Fnr family transcriptional regulator [Candidatus Pacebacteria bacterium]|jgi:CRP-like cAMP-binding protein|nr:Crp/Fnr family transcriptional regulator [Candidatus Paceibacterota bacterium]MBT4652317.1 Crp/Fnr family transcriptional regulator [Candidatus Paceibacterota bacterium]MBT6756144.1 Crp/Fnr family transcriptional regulator [Candidatus Paceibacterota bacterium]MBT6921751.1 Crp/Fnr family transcriptional regulator [Candidatus Paceibacterota bacterium]